MQWMPKWLVFHKSWNGQWNFFFQSKSVKSWLNILHIVEFQKKINECGTLLHTYYIRDSQGLEWYVQPKVPNKIRSFGSHRIHNMVFAYVLFVFRYCCLPRWAATVIAINGTIAMERFYTVQWNILSKVFQIFW